MHAPGLDPSYDRGSFDDSGGGDLDGRRKVEERQTAQISGPLRSWRRYIEGSTWTRVHRTS